MLEGLFMSLGSWLFAYPTINSQFISENAARTHPKNNNNNNNHAHRVKHTPMKKSHNQLKNKISYGQLHQDGQLLICKGGKVHTNTP